MIIGIDASRAQLAQKTGTEWYSFRLIEEMKKIQTDHRIILYTKNPASGALAMLPSNYSIKVLAWPPKYLWTQIRLMWEMLAHPPDVLFSPAHAAPVFSRAKIVITIHDVGFTALPQLYNWKDKLYHRFSTWWNCKFSWRIIVPSNFTKDELIKYYPVDEKKVDVIYHGAPDTPSATYNNSSQDKFLLFVGRLEKKKNLLKIIKAFEIVKRAHKDLNLILVGRPGFGFNKIQNYLSISPYKDSIEIKGYVSEEAKWNLYKNAQALVFPTLYEGFGIPILEAQSVNCPVITSNQGANKEIAGGGAKLVDCESEKEIAKGILELLSNDETKNSLVKLGKENQNRFSWTKCSKATVKILTTLLNSDTI